MNPTPRCAAAALLSFALAAGSQIFAADLLAPDNARSVEAPPLPREQIASLTFAPLLFALDSVEVMGELRLSNSFTVAGILGGGAPSTSSGARAAFTELGAQARFYLLGGFDHGLAVGLQAEVARGHLSSGGALPARRAEGNEVQAWSTGAEGAAFLGYKIVFRPGLTLDLEVGAQAVTASAVARNDVTEKQVSDSGGGLLPMARMNVGWTF